MGTGGRWCGTIFLSAGLIDLIILSIKFDPNHTCTAYFSTKPSVTRVRDTPIRRWRVRVPDTVNFILYVLRVSGMSRWRILSSQLRSMRSAQTRFGPVPVSKIQVIGCTCQNLFPLDTETLYCLLLNNKILPAAGNVSISWYGTFGAYLRVFSIVLAAVICAAS